MSALLKQNSLSVSGTFQEPQRKQNTQILANLWRWAEAFHVAAGAILANRLRTILTIIGITIGVAVVALVAALLEGAERFVARQADELGTGIILIEKASFLDFIGDGDAFFEARAKRPDVTIDDVRGLRDRIGDRVEIGGQVDAVLPIQRGNKTLKGIAIQGVTPNISALTVNKLDRGRELSEFDDEFRRAVCVIGADVADDLFPTDDPIGKKIKLGTAEYEVIGSYARRGSSLGASQDGFIQIPLQSFAKIFGARSRSITLLAKARDAAALDADAAEDLIRYSMRLQRRLDPRVDDNFSLSTSKSIRAFAENITSIVGVVIFPLTGIALLVGGIVVMNMMLASVTERTREIGIRLAIGARRRDILAQFLIESTLLTMIGGMLGVIIAAAIIWLVSAFAPVQLILPLWAVLAALGVSCTVGIGFGVFPARRAARLDPIEALRTE